MNTLQKEKPHHHYIQLSTLMLNDPRLNLKARGLLAYLLTKPSDWKFTIKNMSKELLEGIECIQNTLKELIKIGYIVREKTKEDGKFNGFKYVLKFENFPYPDFPYPDFPYTGKILTKRYIYNNYNNNSNNSNKDISLCQENTNNPNSEDEKMKKVFSQLTNLLIEQIEKESRINKRASKSQWTKIIRKMNQIDGIEIKRLRWAILNYGKIIGRSFVPEVYSAGSFRKKFPQIEKAIERELGKSKTEKPKKIEDQEGITILR